MKKELWPDQEKAIVEVDGKEFVGTLYYQRSYGEAVLVILEDLPREELQWHGTFSWAGSHPIGRGEKFPAFVAFFDDGDVLGPMSDALASCYVTAYSTGRSVGLMVGREEMLDRWEQAMAKAA